MLLLMVKPLRTPTLCRPDVVTPSASVVPVKALAFTVIVMGDAPVKVTPLIVLPVVNVVAVVALPVKAPLKVVAVIVPVPVIS